MKRTLALFLSTLMLLALLTGCGSKAAPRDSADSMMTSQSYYDKAENGYAYEPEAPAADADYGWDDGQTLTGGTVPQSDAKMIYRASIEVQTQDYTTSEAAITELVKSCGGYFESKSLSNRSSGYRYGEFTVRVPAAEYEHFCEQVGSLCHVTYMSSSAENITEEYYDTDSRLKTAQIKLERLQELLDIPANRKVIEFSQISRDGEGQPVAYDVKFVPYARAYPSVESEIRYAVLPDLTFAKLSSFSVYSQITVTAVAAEGEPARALECPEGTPLLLIEQIFLQQDGSRVGVQHHYSRAPRGKLTGTSGHRQ